MRNRTIQLLHQGKRRKIEKHQYSKLRPYNKIKSSRVKESQVNENDLQSFYEQINQQDVLSLIQQLTIANEEMLKQNKNIMRDLNKQEKINRLIMKKISLSNGQLIYPEQQDFYLKYQQNVETLLQVKSNNKQYLKNLQRVLQLKLSFDLMKLQQLLQEKREQHKKLSNNGKARSNKQYIDQLNEQKLTFIRSIFQSLKQNHIFTKNQQMKGMRNKFQALHRDISRKIRQQRKNRRELQKNLEQIQVEIRNLEKLSQGYKKKSGQNSCEYIEVQNGQMRNQQDIKKQLKQIEQNIYNQQNQLHQFVEGKMLQKIHLIQEIQKYQLQCKRLEKRKLSSTSHSYFKIT